MENLISSSNIKIDQNNPWAKLMYRIEWHELETLYLKRINVRIVHPEIPAKWVIAALIIKYKLNLKSDETVKIIAANPILQYFITGNINQNPFPVAVETLRGARERFGTREWKKYKRALTYGPFSTVLSRLLEKLRDNSSFIYYLKTETGENYLQSKIELRRTQREERKNRKKSERKRKKARKYGEIIIISLLVILLISSLFVIVKDLDIQPRKKSTRGSKK